jgi:hypothetical protein
VGSNRVMGNRVATEVSNSKRGMEVVSSSSKMEGMEVVSSRVAMVAAGSRSRVVMMGVMVASKRVTEPTLDTIPNLRVMLLRNHPILTTNLQLHSPEVVMGRHLLLLVMVAVLVETKGTKTRPRGMTKASQLLLLILLVAVRTDRLNLNNNMVDKVKRIMLNHQLNSTHRDRVTLRLHQATETLLPGIDSELLVVQSSSTSDADTFDWN